MMAGKTLPFHRLARSVWRFLPDPIRAKVRENLPANYNRNGYFHVMSPFRTVMDPDARPRVNMILPSVHRKHLTGGPATLINYVLEIKERLPQFDLRLLPVMVPFTGGPRNLPSHLKEFTLLQSADAESGAEARFSVLIDAAQKRSKLRVRRHDIFVASMWPTYFVAKALQTAQQEYFANAHHIQYIIQDYEPLALFPWSDLFLLARQTYEDSQSTVALVATAALSAYLEKAGHGFAMKYQFDPGLNATSISSSELRAKEEVFIVYGRPDTPRNCFPLLFEALLKVTAEHPSISTRFKFISVGEAHPSYPLHNGAMLECRGFLDPAVYKDLILRAAAGVFFVVSPHTGYVALEMARAGALVVSNSFETKRIADLHPNIREPSSMTVDGVADAITRTIQEFWRNPQVGLTAAEDELKLVEESKAFQPNFPFLEEMFANVYSFDKK